MTTTSILLLSADAEAAEPLAAALRAAGHEVTTVADADEAIRRAGEFTLVTIDAVAPPRTGTEVCAEIRRTPALTAIPVLCVSQKDDVEERVRFLEAGRRRRDRPARSTHASSRPGWKGSSSASGALATSRPRPAARPSWPAAGT